MADAYSITNNPLFQNSEHPFSELFALLPKLEREISGHEVNYRTDTNTLKAVHQHTDNATNLLLGSIQSLGTLLAAAADNGNMGLAVPDICNIGWLFRVIGNLLSSCYVLQADIDAELVKRGVNLVN